MHIPITSQQKANLKGLDAVCGFDLNASSSILVRLKEMDRISLAKRSEKTYSSLEAEARVELHWPG